MTNNLTLERDPETAVVAADDALAVALEKTAMVLDLLLAASSDLVRGSSRGISLRQPGLSGRLRRCSGK